MERSFLAATAILVLFCALSTPSLLQAQNDAPPAGETATTEAAETDTGPQGLLGIISAAGPVGLLILLLSVAAVALTIEHVLTIRAPVLMPPGLADRVREQLIAGRTAEARAACEQQPSLLSFVLHAGMSEMEAGWSEIEKAMEEALAEQSARLFRKIEYLSLIGNIAPMLGLLGTVVGMIFAFREVAETQGAATAGDLAEGIYLALITTVLGLIVAIPSVAAFAVFRNRVDQLIAEATYAAQHVFTPIKRRLMSLSAAPPPPPSQGAS